MSKKSRVILAFLGVLLGGVAHSEETPPVPAPLVPQVAFEAQFYTIEGRSQRFAQYRSEHLMLSAQCAQGVRPFPCLAFHALDRASLKGVKKKRGTPNHGALICSQLGGKVVMGLDLEKNENTFCRFKDDSLIDNGTLAFYARKNDRVAGK